MESYLMMLYVTLEQESALKNFFVEHGWSYCKPDTSVITDKLGPVTGKLSIAGEELDVTDTHLQDEEKVPKIKMKILASRESTDKLDVTDTDLHDEWQVPKLKMKIRASREITEKVSVTDTDPHDEEQVPKLKMKIRASREITEKKSPKQRGKRKTKSQKQPTKAPKQAKVVPSISVPEPGEIVFMQEKQNVDSDIEDTGATNKPITMNMEGGEQIKIKIENESQGASEGKKVDDFTNDAEEDDDDGNDDFEATDVDYESENTGNTGVKIENVSDGDNSEHQVELPEDGSAPKSKQNTPRKCKYCEKMYLSVGGLYKHMKSVHSQDKNFVCDLCDAAFHFNHELKNHRISKHFPQSHACKQCGLCFKEMKYLKHHMRYHLEDKEKQFRCKQCPKAYHYSQDLSRHMESHKEKEICFRCNRPIVHMRIHLQRCGKPKQFKPCGICGKLIQKRGLKEHMDNVHATVGRYVCSKCGERFRHRSTLDRHYTKCYLESTESGTNVN